MAEEQTLTRVHAETLTENVRIYGVPAEARLEADGELRWRFSGGGSGSGGGERRMSLDKEVLGIELIGTMLTVRTFVSEIKEGSCGIGRKQIERRVRRDFVIELESEEKAMVWGERLISCISALGRPKRLYIIVNPFGGKQSARKIFLNEVKPLLKSAHILYTMQETNYQLHAQEIANSLDLRKYDGIICVSGDGVLVEVVNGLLQREDWETAIKIPLGIIPAGTGNGMAKSLLHSAGDSYSVSNAVFAIIRGKKRALDVASVVQGQTKFFSVLMLTWGLIADIDIESERYRWMGSARLDFYSLLRVVKLRKYSGSVQFVPAPGYESYGEPLISNQIETSSCNGSCNLSPEGHGLHRGYVGPTVDLGSQQWRCLNGPFISVWINNVPWASNDVMPAPEAKFSDGYLDAVIIKECPKSALLGLMLKMSDGSYVKSPYVIYLKVKAFRLDPGTRIGNPRKGGIVDSDGEVIARGDIPNNNSSSSSNNNNNNNNNNDNNNKEQYLMSYGPPIQMTVEQGLATIFSPR